MDPDNEFAKIVKFLSSILNIEFNKNIITEAIKTSSFDNLKKLEKSGLFGESVADTKSGDKKDFFYLGPKNDWKKLLDNNLIHGNALTVTGKTIEENIKQYKISTTDQQIVREVENPLHSG